ncbi:MAG: NAD(P)/FAD-dependent oxidoreductase [Oscillospiraceae bacterium]|jgi:flavin-dependent dehydrogenase|nr:NAD(P)/FAD-dependent oxidoreductase [Oscillospiraceae bacterium]
MSKKIIVAGAGHGGVAAASLLAKSGLDVTVYDRSKKGNVGYDWTDNFAPGSLGIAGIDMPPENKFTYKPDMTFYSPDEKSPIRQNIPENELEINMERTDLYKHIISHAVKCGVKFVYSCNILEPILDGGRVKGIKTDKGDFYGDLIIDAAGVNSPIRTRMPLGSGVENEVGANNQFYVYRAFYDLGDDPGKVEDKYKVYLLPQGKIGIAWVATEETYSDLLIGRFNPFGEDEIEDSANFHRKSTPTLGTKVQRGGQLVNIPVRQPLSIMVSDGYAAIGDSAFMTVPIIGSGIANSFKAAKLLADTVLADINGAYTADSLWDYQVKFYKEIGSGLAPLACIKNLLTKLEGKDVDYLFANRVLDENLMNFGSEATSVADIFKNVSASDLIAKVPSLAKNVKLLVKLSPVVGKIARAMLAVAFIPKHYSRHDVQKWASSYLRIYR